MSDPKHGGLKTTEFWGTVGVTVLALMGKLPPQTAAWAWPVYAVARGLAKAGILRGTAGEVLNKLPGE
jgi:hypothetical protein